MEDFLKTTTIILLALGLMGIILGISVGLYRNDVLAKMQAEGGEVSNNGQSPDAGALHSERNGLNDVLLWNNLHTILLAVGMILTFASVTLFLFSQKKELT